MTIFKGTDGAIQTAERAAALLAAAQKTDACTKWFMTRGSSRKAEDIRRSSRITLGCQYPPERAYVVLQGRASLVQDRATLHSFWGERLRTYFPGGADDPDTVLVKVEADRIELCVPGSTPEPFGIRYAALERGASGWRIVDE
jgi:general stress protein 26